MKPDELTMLRTAMGISRYELALALNRGYSTLTRYETGVVEIPAEFVLAFSALVMGGPWTIEELREYIRSKTALYDHLKTDSLVSGKTPSWTKLRYEALKAADGKCQLCGLGRADGAKLHVDHIKPRSTHPELASDPNNLQVLCGTCNIGKGVGDEIDWR